jgi:hypothetical protein
VVVVMVGGGVWGGGALIWCPPSGGRLWLWRGELLLPHSCYCWVIGGRVGGQAGPAIIKEHAAWHAGLWSLMVVEQRTQATAFALPLGLRQSVRGLCAWQ